MPFSIPYIIIKNMAHEKKLMIDYSNNPCPKELSKFLKCITNETIITECKPLFDTYMKCDSRYKLRMSVENIIDPHVPENGMKKENVRYLSKLLFSFF